MELKDRFLKYVSFDTQSDESSETFPSTAKQRVLLDYLAEEMKALGLTEVTVDKYGYAMGTIPATPGCEKAPVIGFIAHVDTAPDMSGADVKPHVIENYDGKDIRLNAGVTMKVADFPELSFFKGHTLIHTDGTTLLGADDKAGVAEIMTFAERMLRADAPEHGKIRIGFTPDEEVGRGVDLFDVASFGADFGYTIDGGTLGEINYECFNAASAEINIRGVSVHTGSARGRMVNASLVAMELHELLPRFENPACTDEYEGFFHLDKLEGCVDHAYLYYILRDHDAEKFAQKKALMEKACAYLNEKYGAGTVALKLEDTYFNMKSKIPMEIVEQAQRAMESVGMKPYCAPIRGGTDGSRLSYMGLPCPNLCTGGHSFHGRYEFISTQAMEKVVELLEALIPSFVK